MNFFKNFGTYGLVPVISKSIGFLLIPIYTQYLSVSEFGVQDIFIVFKNFATFFIELELYSAVGRYFFFYKKGRERKELISTAFTTQILTSIVVLFFLITFHSRFYDVLIGQEGYEESYWIILLWIPFSGLVSFFTVIIRFDNKAKSFLIITLIQLIIRVLITIYLIVYLDFGIKGIFIGQLIGSVFASISYYILLKDYIFLFIDKKILKKILKYSLPLVPGLLILGFGPNIARYLIRMKLSIMEVGLYALSIRIVSVFSIISLALKMTWQPYIFELIANKPTKVNNRIVEIYNFFFYMLLVLSLILSMFSMDLIKFIAPSEYYDSYKIIGILSLAAVLKIVNQIVGIGINKANKTFIISKINIFNVLFFVLILFIFLEPIGIMIIPIAALLIAIIKLLVSAFYTKKFMGVSFPMIKTLFLIFGCFIINLIIINYPILIWYKFLFLIFLLTIIYFNRNSIVSSFNKINQNF